MSIRFAIALGSLLSLTAAADAQQFLGKNVNDWVKDLRGGTDAQRRNAAFALGKLGASARITGPLSLRASAGHSFRPPSFSELYLQDAFFEPNPYLRPEQAWSADGALVYDGPLGRASAGVFAALYQDVIVYDSGRVPGSYKPFNFGKASAWGAELEMATAAAREGGL